MKTISLPVFLVTALALTTTSMIGCTGNRGGKKADDAAEAAEARAPRQGHHHGRCG
jgi:hypothetical protein